MGVILHLSSLRVVLFFSVCFINDSATLYKCFFYALCFLFPHGKRTFLALKCEFLGLKCTFLALKRKMKRDLFIFSFRFRQIIRPVFFKYCFGFRLKLSPYPALLWTFTTFFLSFSCFFEVITLILQPC